MSEQVAKVFQLLQVLSQYKEYSWCKIDFFADGSGYFYKDCDHKRETFDSPSKAGEMLLNLLTKAYEENNART